MMVVGMISVKLYPVGVDIFSSTGGNSILPT